MNPVQLKNQNQLVRINPILKDTHTHNEVNEKNSDDDDKEEDDDDDDDTNDYGDESLMDSMVFTHEEASSIYMSATSQSFEKSTTSQGPEGVDNKADEESTENQDPPIVFHMDECAIEFDGLATISNLKLKLAI